jgi:hypothetical protein
LDKGDRITLAVVVFLTVFLVGTAAITLNNAGWFQNPTQTEYIVHTTPVPSPYPSASPVVEYVKVPAPIQTVTQVVEVPVQGSGGGEGCIEAIRAADALAQAVASGKDASVEAATYQAYRSVCRA